MGQPSSQYEMQQYNKAPGFIGYQILSTMLISRAVTSTLRRRSIQKRTSTMSRLSFRIRYGNRPLTSHAHRRRPRQESSGGSGLVMSNSTLPCRNEIL